MKPTLLQDMMTQIDDKYILESHPDTVLATRRARGEVGEKGRPRDLGRNGWNGGTWAAAILSVVVSLGVLAGVIAAGRMGGNTPLGGPGAHNPAVPSDTVDELLENGPGRPEDVMTDVFPTAPEDPAETAAETAPPPAAPGNLAPEEAEVAVLDYLTRWTCITLTNDVGLTDGDRHAASFDNRFFRFTEVSGRWQTASGNQGFDYSAEPLPVRGTDLIRQLDDEGFMFYEVLCYKGISLTPHVFDDGRNLQVSAEKVDASFRAYVRASGRELTTQDTPYTELSTLADTDVYEILVVMTISFWEADLADYDLKQVTLQVPFLLFFTESPGTSVTPDPNGAHISFGVWDVSDPFLCPPIEYSLSTPYIIWEHYSYGDDGMEHPYVTDIYGDGALRIIEQLAPALRENPLYLYPDYMASLNIVLCRPNSCIESVTVLNGETFAEEFGVMATEGSVSTSLRIPFEEFYGSGYDTFFLIIKVAYNDGTTSGECEYPVFIAALTSEETPPDVTTPVYPDAETEPNYVEETEIAYPD